ncbi:MAG: hypothetical protein K2M45_08130 [Muribaculaceae bacterium]|nr:hypothetical protein [Muribaculaceae bacterium]
MSSISLSIPCEQYLKEWFIHDSGNMHPVYLRKGSPESHLLRVLLTSKSNAQSSSISAPEDLRIFIPEYRGMPAERFNHLGEAGKEAMIAIIRQRFDLRLFEDVGELIITGAATKKDILWAWMERSGISLTETNYFAVEKRFDRLRRRLRVARRIRNMRQRKKTMI